jgi:hypothetical protein
MEFIDNVLTNSIPEKWKWILNDEFYVFIGKNKSVDIEEMFKLFSLITNIVENPEDVFAIIVIDDFSNRKGLFSRNNFTYYRQKRIIPIVLFWGFSDVCSDLNSLMSYSVKLLTEIILKSTRLDIPVLVCGKTSEIQLQKIVYSNLLNKNVILFTDINDYHRTSTYDWFQNYMSQIK